MVVDGWIMLSNLLMIMVLPLNQLILTMLEIINVSNLMVNTELQDILMYQIKLKIVQNSKLLLNIHQFQLLLMPHHSNTIVVVLFQEFLKD